ncbi:hypothetical protein [Streptomyces sp. SYSU K21746]
MNISLRRTGIAFAGSVLVGAAFLVPQAQAAPSGQARACQDGSDPASLANPRTAKSVRAPSGALFELRYHDGSACAWGRISSGRKYDSLWVDRAHSLADARAGRWEPQLGFSMLGTATGTYTPAYDDEGYVMRACGEASGTIVCTGWY